MYFQPRALGSISVAVGRSFSTSGCGFIMSALRMNHYCTLFVAVSLLTGDWEGVFVFCFYLDRLVWPLVLGPLQLGQLHPLPFP